MNKLYYYYYYYYYYYCFSNSIVYLVLELLF